LKEKEGSTTNGEEDFVNGEMSQFGIVLEMKMNAATTPQPSLSSALMEASRSFGCWFADCIMMMMMTTEPYSQFPLSTVCFLIWCSQTRARLFLLHFIISLYSLLHLRTLLFFHPLSPAGPIPCNHPTIKSILLFFPFFR